MNLSGNMTRQIEQDMPVTDDSSHIVNVGKLVEDMELKMRNLLRMRMPFHSHFRRLLTFGGGIEEVYFGKAKDVVGDLRSMWLPLSFLSTCHLPRCRHTTFDRSEQREGDTSRDDQLDEAVIGTSRCAEGSRGASSVDSGTRNRNQIIRAVHP